MTSQRTSSLKKAFLDRWYIHSFFLTLIGSLDTLAKRHEVRGQEVLVAPTLFFSLPALFVPSSELNGSSFYRELNLSKCSRSLSLCQDIKKACSIFLGKENDVNRHYRDPSRAFYHLCLSYSLPLQIYPLFLHFLHPLRIFMPGNARIIAPNPLLHNHIQNINFFQPFHPFLHPFTLSLHQLVICKCYNVIVVN